MFVIKENLKKLPDTPGVYIHKDKLGQVIYVGKAVSLKNRVRQYFQSPKNHSPKVRAMVENIEEFEYITCGSEMEALILECNLIKKYQPKYNVLLRDDKTYPYIKITMSEDYPRLVKTRRIEKDGAKYYGPYSDTGAVNKTVDMLNSIFKLKRCSATKFSEGFRPCLNYHIKQCSGICGGGVSRGEYAKSIEQVISFLDGRQKPILEYLKEKMAEASEAMDYEQAAQWRDRIFAVEALDEKQRVTMLGAGDFDIVLPLRTAKEQYAVVFFIRDGKLSGRENYPVSEGLGEEFIPQFIEQYYASVGMLPKEILLAKEPEENALIEQYLSELRGSKVKIYVPQRGEKKALLELTLKDVAEMSKNIDERMRVQEERANALSDEIAAVLSEWAKAHGRKAPEKKSEYRSESYDISNTNGIDTVGAMVVFVGSKPFKRDYRRFKVRTSGADDYASLQEVLYRRFRRAQAGDPGFSVLPDVLLIDGGKGQVSSVETVLNAMKIDIPVIGMAKDDHHRTRALVWSTADGFGELPLADRPMLFKFCGSVQEEVHRFVIEYHRGLRGKSVTGSVLDEIKGIGPAKRNALLAYFGSVENIKAADSKKLTEVYGITPALADRIVEYFH